jgi:hypothetical protein
LNGAVVTFTQVVPAASVVKGTAPSRLASLVRAADWYVTADAAVPAREPRNSSVPKAREPTERIMMETRTSIRVKPAFR